MMIGLDPSLQPKNGSTQLLWANYGREVDAVVAIESKAENENRELTPDEKKNVDWHSQRAMAIRDRLQEQDEMKAVLQAKMSTQTLPENFDAKFEFNWTFAKR